MADTYLIVGLGNPGSQYAATRHNIGQLVVELLAARSHPTELRHNSARTPSYRVALKKQRGINAVVAETRLGVPTSGVASHRVILAIPGTYMNQTGGPVAALARYYQVAPAHVIAIHDDVDLPFDTVRLKLGGGEGGHNGLRDITRALGTKDYLRVRMGVGRPPGNQPTSDFVLSRFNASERAVLPAFLDAGADATAMLINEGLLNTQQYYHSKAP